MKLEWYKVCLGSAIVFDVLFIREYIITPANMVEGQQPYIDF